MTKIYVNAAIKLENNIKANKIFIKKSKEGDLNTMKKLIERFNVNVNSTHSNGSSALIYACKKGHAHIVKFLGRKYQ